MSAHGTQWERQQGHPFLNICGSCWGTQKNRSQISLFASSRLTMTVSGAKNFSIVSHFYSSFAELHYSAWTIRHSNPGNNCKDPKRIANLQSCIFHVEWQIISSVDDNLNKFWRRTSISKYSRYTNAVNLCCVLSSFTWPSEYIESYLSHNLLEYGVIDLQFVIESQMCLIRSGSIILAETPSETNCLGWPQ